MAGFYRFILFSLLLMNSTIALTGPSSMPPTPVEVISPKTLPIIHGVTATGELFANRSITIKPEIAGKVVAINLPEGKKVDAQTVLVELDDAIASATLRQAIAKHDNSLLRYNRLQTLSQKGTGSTSERDDAFSTLRHDEANLALAKAQFEKTKIKAPFTGILGLRQIDLGEYINPGHPLITLDDIQTLLIDFSVPENYYTKIKTEQTVEVTVSSLPNQRFEGKIIALSPQINLTTHTVQARAMLSNTMGLLRPGLFAKVKVVFSKNTHAIVVPEQAVFNQQGKQYVYLIKEGSASIKEVTLGAREKGGVEILKGLSLDDKVAYSGHMRLYDGAKVFEVKS